MNRTQLISRRSLITGLSVTTGAMASGSYAWSANRSSAAAMGPSRSTMTRGVCDHQFKELAAEFERNFRERNEVGASVCVIHNGRTVVDLWGGKKNDQEPWEEDTLVVVYSCSKAATAICAHVLASRGEISFDDPVSKYWPAFGSSDKKDITIRMFLNHSSGMVGASHELTASEIVDWDHMIQVLEQEAPVWRPGSRWGYHGLTYGFLVGEVVRRVSGQSIGTFFRKNVGVPLGADFWIGLPQSEDHRVAATIMVPRINPITGKSSSDGEPPKLDPIQQRMLNSIHGFDPNLPGMHRAEIPASGGISNARGMARMLAPLARPSKDVRFVTPDQHQQMMAVESAGQCATTGQFLRFSTGFEKGKPGNSAVNDLSAQVHSESAFGHSGYGGSVCLADPEAGFSFAYAMNRQSSFVEPYFARPQAMLDAVYKALGYQSKASGRWRI